ncbi:hypothetical protein A3J78_02430 [Candidatus Beckwithbacteria bacterium RBG_13_35_6]|uniref:Uncharacterized protein n=1 Tax=Candidatus Beckwithbacteria bacterium RBG_13_35_6 TaxID=1797456 RepID=A0A1F5DE05_9BACT|nr:MAG: hypothetical protein A3J78_02430 [Candidatus Beckwithbacteria bacterium RBG_13_35_6]
MTDELITLFHGTEFYHVFSVLCGCSDLFGKRLLDGPQYSGSLTNQFQTAILAAHIATTDPLAGEIPTVLIFQIPQAEVIDEGPIRSHDETVRAFSTIHEVAPEELPPEYLDVLSWTAKEARAKVDLKTISFHKIPTQYLSKIVLLDRL